MTSRFIPVVGLEIHAQLKTATKLFCSCANLDDAAPNTTICPVCTGLPGSLPVLNRHGVRLALRAARVFECRIQPRSRFDRKQYHYPDLPRGFQITQKRDPLALGGHIRDLDGTVLVDLARVHLEDDAGRSRHSSTSTLVDHNRCGTPLIEIVTDPALSSGADASAVLRSVRSILRYAEVCDGNMENGQLRCDANVSLRYPGKPGDCPRVEVKNINSLRFLRRAVDAEITRQAALLETGLAVLPETRLYDEQRNETRPMRGKETNREYRYLPEPDLPALDVSTDTIEQAGEDITMPWSYVERCISRNGVSRADALQLAEERCIAEYTHRVLAGTPEPVIAVNWIMANIRPAWDARGESPPPVPAEHLIALTRMVQEGRITDRTARELLCEMIAHSADPEQLVQTGNLERIHDETAIRRMIEHVINEHPYPVARFRAGESKLLHFLMGKVMEQSSGRADPEQARTLLIRTLENS